MESNSMVKALTNLTIGDIKVEIGEMPDAARIGGGGKKFNDQTQILEAVKNMAQDLTIKIPVQPLLAHYKLKDVKPYVTALRIKGSKINLKIAYCVDKGTLHIWKRTK